MFVLVTVKLPRNPEHDPRRKVTGPCPVNGSVCTDVTGEHHTVAVSAPPGCAESAAIAGAEAFIRAARPGIHITRSEIVPWADDV